MDPSQLAHIESLCHALYLGNSPTDRAMAQQQLLTLSTSPEYIPQCQYILTNSTQPYALLLAANTLEILLTTYWNNFTSAQRVELQDYLLQYLIMNSHQLDDYVIASIIKLLCRIIKLGWFDIAYPASDGNMAGQSNGGASSNHQYILNNITQFLCHNDVNYIIIGMKILVQLVNEMNIPITGKTLTQHRKVAVSFRDNLLYPIFIIGINILQQINLRTGGRPGNSGNNGPLGGVGILPPALLSSGILAGGFASQSGFGSNNNQDDYTKLCNITLTLLISCLSFDFIGTNPEESPEDVGTVQVPSSWRPIIQDTAVLELLFSIYYTNSAPRSSQAMECIVQLSSIRRSLFTTEKERQVFLDYLMSQIQEIMSSKFGLDDENNYHEFCRLLGRLKASYQLSELIKTRGFGDWLALASDFTTKSLLNWQYSMNSIHYLLALWSRLVAALPYLRPDTGIPSSTTTTINDTQLYSNIIKQCIMNVLEAYIQTMLESVEVIVNSDGDIDDPLEDEGTLKEQMEKLPTLIRLQYDTIAQYLLNMIQNNLNLYDNMVQQLGNQSIENVPLESQRQLHILDGRLTWMVHIIASVIGSSPTSSVTAPTSTTESQRNDQLFDGQLSRHIFLLIQLIEYRLDATNGAGKCSEHLEIALLRFFQAFKRSYLMDSGGLGSPLGIGATSGSTSMVPGGEAAHPLLSLALSYSNDQNMSNESMSIFDTMGLGDHTSIMNIIVSKICSNIRYWNQSHSLLDITLDLFVDLISSYSSSKTLLSLEMIQFMIHNHSPMTITVHGRGNSNQVPFPFLAYDNDNKYRIAFYTALSRLVFTAAEDLNNSFDLYIAPKLSIIEQLASLGQSDLSTSTARVAIICICRDFRGISAATTSKRTYNLLFDVLYPTFFNFLKNATEVWCADPPVMTAILKFLQEFVFNKSQRIFFEQSSANGILLFRETSAIVCSYGSRILEIPVNQDIYAEKYKGIRLMLNVLTCALSGGYVNFGVFALYEDKALQNALDVSLQMCLQIPLDDILTYMKLSKAYFGFMEVLMKGHLDVLCGLSSTVFITLIKTLHEGLQSSDAAVCALCATAIDHLFTYIFLNQRRDKPTIQLIREHISSEPDLPDQLMATLFNTLLFATQANHWAITRPILSLMLTFESSFGTYRDTLLQNQPPENQQKLLEEFDKLTADIQTSVETSNRDRFTQKLTLFRLNVRQFLAF